jgi:hypothetical protein
MTLNMISTVDSSDFFYKKISNYQNLATTLVMV